VIGISKAGFVVVVGGFSIATVAGVSTGERPSDIASTLVLAAIAWAVKRKSKPAETQPSGG
jgi:hypothetical protein